VSPDEIRRLRQELNCTARELAATIGVEASEVRAWELGERFPTKKTVSELTKLRFIGATAIVRKSKRKASAQVQGMSRLNDPMFWMLVRKILEYPELFEEALSLAANYPEPSEAQTNKFQRDST
jgi:transcriptional regulator with XRE-family HTH domain